MMARRKIVMLVAGLVALCGILAVGLGGCKDLTFNGDMKGYLEYWTDTVSVASARWSASPEQQTAGGRTTVATNATITASLTISNPEGYSLESVVSHASGGPHAVEVSGPASGTVLGLTKVTAVTPTSLSVEVAPVAHVPTPASLALEHTDFTVKISPTRSETAMQSPNPLVLSLRYNTPPRMPLAVMENGSGGYRWPRSGDKWEAIPSTPLYYAWPQNKTRDGGGRPTDPDYVERFYIEDNGTSGGKLEAEAGLPEQGTLTGSDGTVYNIYKYDPTGTSVTIYAEDGEGVRGAGIISGLLHEVTLEGNGGLFGSSQSVTVYRSDGSSLTGGDLEVPTMPGFYLSGWTEGGNTVTFPRTVSSPVTLVAQWTANPAGGGSGGGSGTGGGGTTPSLHTVTYSGNGDDGTGAVPKEQAKFSGGTITIEGNSGNLARTGYTFAGWNTEAGGTGTPYREGDSYTDDASVTLHAQWTANDYTVTLDDDGGSGGSGTVDVTYGMTLPNVTPPTMNGYTFKGYWTQPNGQGKQYYDKDGNGVNTWQETAVTTLHAQWDANKYSVQFYPNGGSGALPTRTFTYDTPENLPSNQFSKSGYTFAGWATSSTGSVVYPDGSSILNLTAVNGDQIEFYAIWGKSAASLTDVQALVNSASSSSDPVTIVLTGDLTLTNATSNSYALTIPGGANVTLQGDGQKRIIKGNSTGWIEVSEGTLTLGPNLVIDGDNASSHWGAISVECRGTLIMEDGAEIINMTSSGSTCSAVMLTKGNSAYGGTFIMNGGRIENNYGAGAAVAVGGGSTFIMNGGQIVGNTTYSTVNSGGVNVDQGGEFTMNGGTITGNYKDGSTKTPSDVIVESGGTFVQNGGTIGQPVEYINP